VATQDAIWHVIIDGEQRSLLLSRAQVVEYLHDGQLIGSDLIWRSGFSDWKSISEVADFWQPPKRGLLRFALVPAPTEQPAVHDDQVAVATDKKWSIWRTANAGLLVSVLVPTLQIAGGRGVELASLVQTASAETVAQLAAQILAVPLLFVLIALIRNIFKRRLPKSDARAIEGPIVFSLLLVGIGCAFVLYGQWFFGSNEQISGSTRDYVIRKVQHVCIQRQMSLKQGASPSDAQISNYCTCVSIQLAEKTTYKRLASDTTAPDVRDYLKQQAEAAGQACRTWMAR
jgi:GYF domain 2